MRILLVKFFLLLSFGITFGLTQDTITLSTSDFQIHQRLFLAPLDGWIFRPGTDRSWANENIDLAGWKNFNPTELTAEMADKSGRVEGWFRIKIKLDGSFKNLPLAISRNLWAATDVYLDGKLLYQFGNTGNPYTASNPVLKYPVPIQLEVGKVHLIAVHFVDYETTFTQREIRLKPENLKSFLTLAGPEYVKRVTEDYKLSHIYGTLCICVAFLLFFLFWLLVLLNPDQKIFRIIATITTLVLLGAIGNFLETFFDLSYSAEKLRYVINVTIHVMMNVSGIILLEWLLIRKTTWISITLLIVVSITSTFAHLFSISPPFGIAFTCLLGYFGFLLFKNRKVIHGAKWAVVAATIIPIVVATVYINIHKYSLDLFYEYEKPMVSLTLLSSPLFLLVYISLRFKEILKDIADENYKVLKITDEKQVLLSTQNERLEMLVGQRTSELEKSLSDLRSTQSQLIQSEKMASLGELTAGIAHEIQNPLNFVNNFSELNRELISEIQDERRKAQDKRDETLEEEILRDIKDNSEKINHHGKRAADIVKGMLQHSRSSSGVKEPTDINALADEYLRLSYHGLRAKDKSFNATMKTDFDETIGNINVQPQEIGRVVLNLINNGFYTVNERANNQQLTTNNQTYEPSVTISTKKHGDKIEIRVTDNGNGIPQKVLDKIFQPFFTTKPTGQGTGLGLSLSYDIVTKGHGGELKVETKEGEGSTFIIVLQVA